MWFFAMILTIWYFYTQTCSKWGNYNEYLQTTVYVDEEYCFYPKYLERQA